MRETKKQLEERARIAGQESSLLHCALNDVINGKVQWFGVRKVQIGICRPCGAEGGIALVRFDDYTRAYLWEEWWPQVRDDWGSKDPDFIKLRELAHEAHNWILEKQRLEPLTQCTGGAAA